MTDNMDQHDTITLFNNLTRVTALIRLYSNANTALLNHLIADRIVPHTPKIGAAMLAFAETVMASKE